MTSAENPQGAPDDTAAFQRFYSGEARPEPQTRSFLYRLLVGWWRDR